MGSRAESFINLILSIHTNCSLSWFYVSFENIFSPLSLLKANKHRKWFILEGNVGVSQPIALALIHPFPTHSYTNIYVRVYTFALVLENIRGGRTVKTLRVNNKGKIEKH